MFRQLRKLRVPVLAAALVAVLSQPLTAYADINQPYEINGGSIGTVSLDYEKEQNGEYLYDDLLPEYKEVADKKERQWLDKDGNILRDCWVHDGRDKSLETWFYVDQEGFLDREKDYTKDPLKSYEFYGTTGEITFSTDLYALEYMKNKTKGIKIEDEAYSVQITNRDLNVTYRLTIPLDVEESVWKLPYGEYSVDFVGVSYTTIDESVIFLTKEFSICSQGVSAHADLFFVDGIMGHDYEIASAAESRLDEWESKFLPQQTQQTMVPSEEWTLYPMESSEESTEGTAEGTSGSSTHSEPDLNLPTAETTTVAAPEESEGSGTVIMVLVVLCLVVAVVIILLLGAAVAILAKKNSDLKKSSGTKKE